MSKKRKIHIFKYPFDLLEKEKKYTINPKKIKKELEEIEKEYSEIKFIEREFPDEETYIIYDEPVGINCNYIQKIVEDWIEINNLKYKEIVSISNFTDMRNRKF